MIELIAGILMISGACVVLVGGLGLLRLPDFFCRLHGAGVIDTLGIWLVVAGLLCLADSWVSGFKLVLLVVLTMMLSPVVSHALARAALDSSQQEPGADRHAGEERGAP